jgi:hypothetical protein
MASQARFILVEKGQLPLHLADFCLFTTAEIIASCKGLTIETLRQRYSDRESANADLAQKFSTRRDLVRFVASDDFKLGLFLEVLYYVVSIADFLFQLRKDKDFYFEVREEVQPCLYDALHNLFAFDEEQMKEVEDTLVTRADVYCADLGTSTGMLLSYIRDWGTAEWQLILSHAAEYYAMVVSAEAFGNTLINHADVEGDFEIRCTNCSETLSGKVPGELFLVTCRNCRNSFEIACARGLR